ncbi:unnamed protein product [Cunninghamella echinulata]
MLYRLAFSALLTITALQGLNGFPLGLDFGKKDRQCTAFQGSIADRNDVWRAEVDKDNLFEKNANGVMMKLDAPNEYKTATDKNEKYDYNTNVGSGPTFTYIPQIQYGKVTATIQAPETPGSVTALIFKSSSGDEIDYELLSGPDEAQTNYYWGKKVETGVNGDIEETDVSSRPRKYTIDWTPDYIKWSIDDRVIRTVNKGDTGGKFPENPSQIQIGLWDGSEQAGTARWAHGPINWDDHQGAVEAIITDVTVECDNF